MTLERAEPPLAAQEREMLNSWLEFHRATLAPKCDGLTGDQLRQLVPARCRWAGLAWLGQEPGVRKGSP